MRRRRASAPTFGLSLLDLLSCAFAGVIVLAVVMSALLGSSRVIEERSFLVLDVTVSAPEEPNVSPERRAAIDQLQLGLQLQGPDWKAIWWGDKAELPIRDSEVTTTVLSGVTDGQSGRRHLTVIVRGLAQGTYRARVKVAGLVGENPAWEIFRTEVEGKLLLTEIEVHYPGANVNPISETALEDLDGALWEDELTIRIDN